MDLTDLNDEFIDAAEQDVLTPTPRSDSSKLDAIRKELINIS